MRISLFPEDDSFAILPALLYSAIGSAMLWFLWITTGLPFGPADMTARWKTTFAVISWILRLITGKSAPTVNPTNIIVVLACIIIVAFVASSALRDGAVDFVRSVGSHLLGVFVFVAVIPAAGVLLLAMVIPDMTRHTVSLLWGVIGLVIIWLLGNRSGSDDT